MTISPFDYVKSINTTKEELEDLSGYVPFITNKALSYFPDTIFYANEMNQHNDVPPKGQFLYYLNTITRAKRFSKWHKPEDNETLELVKEYFGYGAEKAKQNIRILTKEQLEEIKTKIKGIAK